ncbi:hypothetical protein [Corynebacterium variabile]|uniref:hypothetical protein n=1 Tax=Corynebacterium variabile TaxID=1727 RepID=UPI003A8C92CD
MKPGTGLWSIILAVCSMLCTIAALVCLGLLVFKDSDGDAVAAPASSSEDAPVIVTITQGAGDSGGPEPTATGGAGDNDVEQTAIVHDWQWFYSSDRAVMCEIGPEIGPGWVGRDAREQPNVACFAEDYTGPEITFSCPSRGVSHLYMAVSQKRGMSPVQGACRGDMYWSQGYWSLYGNPGGEPPSLSAGEKVHREGYTCTGGDTITCTEDATGYGFSASVSAIELIEP